MCFLFDFFTFSLNAWFLHCHAVLPGKSQCLFADMRSQAKEVGSMRMISTSREQQETFQAFFFFLQDCARSTEQLFSCVVSRCMFLAFTCQKHSQDQHQIKSCNVCWPEQTVFVAGTCVYLRQTLKTFTAYFTYFKIIFHLMERVKQPCYWHSTPHLVWYDDDTPFQVFFAQLLSP